jgi:hypothetical protein
MFGDHSSHVQPKWNSTLYGVLGLLTQGFDQELLQ